MKRVFDLIIASLLAPVALTVCILVAIPIMIECRGSPFFRQVRLGQHERLFRLLKLRTMAIGTKDAASHEIGTSTVLRTGVVLRKLKIDELPQIWNVLIGDMSFVGPRPGLPVQTELTKSRREYGVYDLRPGITGLSQIEGLDMSTPHALAISDARYLGKWSPRQDIAILLGTAFGKGFGDAAAPERKNL